MKKRDLKQACGYQASALRLGVAITFLAIAVHAGSARAADDDEWWQKMKSAQKQLFSVISNAEKGSRDASHAAAIMLFRGYGSSEGEKPLAAHYYMAKAAEAGHDNAMLYTAVIDAVNRKTLEAPGVSAWLEKYRQSKTGKAQVALDTCKGVQRCVDYYQLLSGYFQLVVSYPASARYEGKQANHIAIVDLETRTVSVSEADATNPFSIAVTKALGQAMAQVPEPNGFDRKGRKLEFPVSFKLSE